VDDHLNHRFGLRRKHAASGGRWLIPLVPPFLAKASARMRHLPPPPAGGGRLLDVGFGNGSFLKIANEMGWNAEGIDFDPQAVEVARARGLNVSCATVAELSTRNEGYDIITLSHVIEHIHDPIALLHNIYELLKPNGHLWLETPNIASLGAARFGKHWRGLEVPRHLVLFNSTSLCKALNSVGFRRIEQRWHGMTLFSIYAESATIASDQDVQGAKQYAWLTPRAVVDELREMLQPRKREFITLIAYK
jgi:2-polyprenyl-3-methyl-5-hydroxy-6-metoxy-1,4-benzoquinol methylase